MFQYWLLYYIDVGLFAAGMSFGTIIDEKSNITWRDVVGVILTGLLWPLLVLYLLLHIKHSE